MKIYFWGQEAHFITRKVITDSLYSMLTPHIFFKQQFYNIFREHRVASCKIQNLCNKSDFIFEHVSIFFNFNQVLYSY